jgi:hypothetical protein
VRLAQAFEVFDEIVAAGTLSLTDRTQEQLATLAAIERYDLQLDADDHGLASLSRSRS